jgi:sugar O-acyltransferase (sialic acid O-acetyltransferase NeuD family)
MKPLAIIGAGGFAREVLDVVDAINAEQSTFEISGVYADGGGDEELLASRGTPLRGSIDVFESSPTPYVIAIGAGHVRRAIDRRLSSLGVECPVLIHPSSTRGLAVDLGPGTIVCSHVSITTNVRLGRHVHLNLNSTIGHDCRIGDYVTVSPLVAVSGRVVLHPGASLGTSSAVIERLTIGEDAVVGAGAVVTRSVDAGTTVVGVPARALERARGS